MAASSAPHPYVLGPPRNNRGWALSKKNKRQLRPCKSGIRVRHDQLRGALARDALLHAQDALLCAQHLRLQGTAATLNLTVAYLLPPSVPTAPRCQGGGQLLSWAWVGHGRELLIT